MKRYLSAPLFVVFMFAACSSPDGDGIPPEKMQHILYDMNAAEAYSTMVKKEDTSNFNMGKNSDSLARYYNEILAHYNVTREQFDKSMLWYKKNPSKLDSLYYHMAPDIAKQK